MSKEINLSIKSLGILKFNPDGVLFAGDNALGAIHAIDLSFENEASEKFEVNVYEVDAQIAAILGTAQNQIQVNDLAVHPKSGEVYLSITRGHGSEALPALIKVDKENQIHNLDIAALAVSTQVLQKLPDENKKVSLRGTGGPPTPKEIAKSKQSLRTLAIVSIEFFKNELFVSGISNEEFCSVLRRLPYPFNGQESISNIEMYHIVHDNYESRAPIRSMAVQKIDGIDQLVAAYTCSPLVLIPLNDLKDNAKVKARTIGDMGNGQPIDMVPFKMGREEMLFVTNNSRSPVVIAVSELQNAKVVTKKDFKRGPKLDTNPIMPYGPVGKPVMFSGASLRIDLLNEKQFVSLNRDIEKGTLDLETVLTKIPFKLHNIIGDKDVEYKWGTFKNAVQKIIYKATQ